MAHTSAAGLTQIRVTLSHRQETGTKFGVALSLTAASGETILTWGHSTTKLYHYRIQ